MNSATQNAIGYALALLLDTTLGDNNHVPKLTIKQLYAVAVRNSAASGSSPQKDILSLRYPKMDKFYGYERISLTG